MPRFFDFGRFFQQRRKPGGKAKPKGEAREEPANKWVERPVVPPKPPTELELARYHKISGELRLEANRLKSSHIMLERRISELRNSIPKLQNDSGAAGRQALQVALNELSTNRKELGEVQPKLLSAVRAAYGWDCSSLARLPEFTYMDAINYAANPEMLKQLPGPKRETLIINMKYALKGTQDPNILSQLAWAMNIIQPRK